MSQDGKDGSTIPTTEKTQRIPAGEAGFLLVRRIPRSQVERIMDAAGLKFGDAGSAVRFARLVFCFAVVDGEVAGVSFAQQKHPTLGRIACNELYDAVDDDVIAKVVELATATLPASATGN